jgi:hypothetical protein
MLRMGGRWREGEKTSNPGWSADGQPIANDFTSTQDDAGKFMTFHTINERCYLLSHHVSYTVLIELTTARLLDKSEADIRHVMVFYSGPVAPPPPPSRSNTFSMGRRKIDIQPLSVRIFVLRNFPC